MIISMIRPIFSNWSISLVSTFFHIVCGCCVGFDTACRRVNTFTCYHSCCSWSTSQLLAVSSVRKCCDKYVRDSLLNVARSSAVSGHSRMFRIWAAASTGLDWKSLKRWSRHFSMTSMRCRFCCRKVARAASFFLFNVCPLYWSPSPTASKNPARCFAGSSRIATRFRHAVSNACMKIERVVEFA